MTRQFKEKEVEVGKAFQRKAELEARATQLRAEAQAWQVRTEGFTAATLHAQLQAVAGDDDVNNRIIHTYMCQIRVIIELF